MCGLGAAADEFGRRRLRSGVGRSILYMSASRLILHLDVDNFYYQCHLLDDPSLAGRPVVIHQHNMGGIVALSDEAKALGIKPGEGIGRAGDKALKRGGRSITELKLKHPELVALLMDAEGL